MNANLSAMQGTTYPNTLHICNPFLAPPEYLYQPENCPADTVRIGDIPRVRKVTNYDKIESFVIQREIEMKQTILHLQLLLLNHFLKVLKIYKCSDGMCKDGSGFISGSVYNRVEAYTSSIQDLLNVYPSMQKLVECQTVEQAFSDIIVRHCKPLKKYARMSWAAMLFLALLMLSSLLLWTNTINHPSFSHTYIQHKP